MHSEKSWCTVQPRRPVRLSSMIHRPCLTLRRLALASKRVKNGRLHIFKYIFFTIIIIIFIILQRCSSMQRCCNPILKSSKRRSSLSFLSPLSLLFTLNVKIQVCLKKSFIKLQCQSEITHTAANYYFLLKPIIDHLKRRRLLWSFWVVFNSHWTQLMTWSRCSFLSTFFKRFVSVCIQQRTRRTWTNLCGWPKKHAS